jgi:hypothetical protein
LTVDRNHVHVALQWVTLKPVVEYENLRAESRCRTHSNAETIIADEYRDARRMRGENHRRSSGDLDTALDIAAVRNHEHRITPSAHSPHPARSQRNSMTAATQCIRNPSGGQGHARATHHEAANTDDAYR